MSKQGHSVLWNNVFGISDYNSRQNIQSLWDTAQEVIDEYDEDYKELRKNFGKIFVGAKKIFFVAGKKRNFLLRNDKSYKIEPIKNGKIIHFFLLLTISYKL